jgi:putative membrane protein
MERKLYYGITTPGGVLTILFGLWLLYGNGWALYAHAAWMHWKLALVAVLIGYHLYLGKLLADFRNDRILHGHVFYRWLNEFPVLVLVAVILLVELQPN